MTLVTTSRTTLPEMAPALAAVQTALGGNVTVRLAITPQPSVYAVFRDPDTPLTAAEVTAVRTALQAVQNMTPQGQAQEDVDRLSLLDRAIALTLLDLVNAVITGQVTQPVTETQFRTRVKQKVAAL